MFSRTLARRPLLGLRRRRQTREAVVIFRGWRPVAQRVGLGRQGPVVVHASAPAAVAVTVPHPGRRRSGGWPPVRNPAVLGLGLAIPVVLLRPGARGGVGGVDGALVIPGAVLRRRVSWRGQDEPVVGPQRLHVAWVVVEVVDVATKG